jgi:hypothetical protein
VKLRELVAPRRRRRKPRSDGPKTIVPIVKGPGPLTDPFDAARERLKAQVPPRSDED